MRVDPLRRLGMQADRLLLDTAQRTLRPGSYYLRPGTHADEIAVLAQRVRALDDERAAWIELFSLGRSVGRSRLARTLDDEIVDALVGEGLITATDDALVANGVGLNALHGVWGFASLPGSGALDAVYLGPDSYQLAHHLPVEPGARVLDVCTGAGFLALAAGARRGVTAVVGTDLNPRAVALASINARLNGMDDRVTFREGDTLAPLAPDEQFDLVVCNPPFVPVPPGDLLPLFAGGGDRGLEVLDSVLAALPAHLAPGGRALFVVDGYGGPHGPWVLESLERWIAEHPGYGATAWMTFRLTLGEPHFARLAATAAAVGEHDPAQTALRLGTYYQRIGMTHGYPQVITEIRPESDRRAWRVTAVRLWEVL